MSTAVVAYLPFTKSKTYCNFTHYTMSQLGAFLKTGALSDLLKGTAIQTKRDSNVNPKLWYNDDAPSSIELDYSGSPSEPPQQPNMKPSVHLPVQFNTYQQNLKLEQLDDFQIIKEHSPVVATAKWDKTKIAIKFYLVGEQHNPFERHTQINEQHNPFERHTQINEFEASTYSYLKRNNRLQRNIIPFVGIFKFESNRRSYYIKRKIYDSEPSYAGYPFEKTTLKAIVTEFQEYPTLSEYLNDPHIHLQFRYVHCIVIQLLYCISELAAMGIQHNDLHERNIFIGKFKAADSLEYNFLEKTFTFEDDDPKVIIFDFDLAYRKNPPLQTGMSQELFNNIRYMKNDLCKNYGLCKGVNERLDLYRFVYSLKHRFEKKLQNNISRKECMKIFDTMYTPFEINKKGTYVLNETKKKIKKYITPVSSLAAPTEDQKIRHYYPCNKQTNAATECTAYNQDEPLQIRNIKYIIDHYTNTYGLLTGGGLTYP